MIRNILLLLGISFLLACKGDSPSSEESSTDGADVTLGKAPIPIAGNWIHEAYYNSIKSNQSPRRAQKTCEVCFVRIPANPKESTTLVYNFHEAMENTLVTGQNDQFQLWESDEGKPVKMIDSIKIKNKNKIIIGDNTFININTSPDGTSFKILEQLLFKGTYLTENGGAIEFKKQGDVTGLGDFKYYEPMLDYNDAGRNIDQVMLGKNKNDMKAYAFKFNKKNLQIFELACKTKDNSGDCMEVAFGKVLYTLKKTN